jgi:hypothetical protein
MIRQPTPRLADLYLADETAWLDAMAELVGEERLDDLDYAHLKEFLEDMATRDRREVNSRLRVLLTHVLKWTFQQEMRTPSWESTVANQQEDLEDLLGRGVLRNHADESLAAIYPKAVKIATRETKLPTATFPGECPWTLDQLLSAEVLDQ